MALTYNKTLAPLSYHPFLRSMYNPCFFPHLHFLVLWHGKKYSPRAKDCSGSQHPWILVPALLVPLEILFQLGFRLLFKMQWSYNVFPVTLPCKFKHHSAIAVFGNSANNCTGGATVLGDISLQGGLFQVRTQSEICAWLDFFQQDFITDKEKAFIINWSHL